MNSGLNCPCTLPVYTAVYGCFSEAKQSTHPVEDSSHGNQLRSDPRPPESDVFLGSQTASKPRPGLCTNPTGASGGRHLLGSSLSGSALFIKGREASFHFQGILASPSRILKQ
jgi:hypothetical protein